MNTLMSEVWAKLYTIFSRGARVPILQKMAAMQKLHAVDIFSVLRYTRHQWRIKKSCLLKREKQRKERGATALPLFFVSHALEKTLYKKRHLGKDLINKNQKNIVYLSLNHLRNVFTNSKSSRWRRSANCGPLHCLQ